LNKSRLPTLKIRRLRTMAIEVYKILNKKSPMNLNDLFVYKESRYSFRKTNTVEVPQVRTTYHGLHSFRLIFINKSEGPFLNFFNFSGIGLTTKMPNNWAIIKITHYKRKI
jgi:hypothetical protein